MNVFRQKYQGSDRLLFTTRFYNLVHCSIFTSLIVTSDVISAKFLEIHRLSWECRDELFAMSNTNLNIKMVYRGNNFTDIF